MIAKVEWFNRRKYTGWGLTPRTWQGWVYVIVLVLVITSIQQLVLDETVKMALMGLWMVFVLIDSLQVMASIKLDEREQKIEAIAERNASWTMVAASVSALLYVATLGRELPGIELMPIVTFPIIAGVAVKGISNYILDKSEI